LLLTADSNIGWTNVFNACVVDWMCEGLQDSFL